jgi:predicted NAD-dependent protein-ADP-ribosyltransferase YbiA (DUF1768 family)
MVFLGGIMKAFVMNFSTTLLLSLTVLISACDSPFFPSQPNSNPPIKTAEQSWKNDYPAHWWQEVPRQNAKSWEILPQEAGPMEVILSKRNELGLLSNFSETPFVYHGVCYPTVEAFWQMMKYPETLDDPRWQWSAAWRWTREQVAGMNGYSAKAAGNYANSLMEKNDANWASFEEKKITFVSATPGDHYHLIWEALLEKIRQNPQVQNILLQTKNLKLRPDHSVSDKSPREWHFYLLWMDIRELIASGKLNLKSTEDLSLRTCKAKDY